MIELYDSVEYFDREEWALKMFEKLSDHNCDYARIGVWTSCTHGVIQCRECKGVFGILFKDMSIWELN